MKTKKKKKAIKKFFLPASKLKAIKIILQFIYYPTSAASAFAATFILLAFCFYVCVCVCVHEQHQQQQ